MTRQVFTKTMSSLMQFLPTRQHSRTDGESPNIDMPSSTFPAIGNESVNSATFAFVPSDKEDGVLYLKSGICLQQKSGNGSSYIPGQLFVVTRGADFGTTLILNWIPVSEGGKPPPVKSLSADLSQVEIVRVFCHEVDGEIVNGEMVITSRDKTFPIFRVNDGQKLKELILVFKEWNYFHYQLREKSHHTFTIIRPQLNLCHLHPEEGGVRSVLTEHMWKDLLDTEGRIVDQQLVRKVIFFQGVALGLRKVVWPFLLGVYSFGSTSHERMELKERLMLEYSTLQAKRARLDWHAPERKLIMDQVCKDIVRTDRTHPYFRGEDNKHIDMLKDILLNYFIYKPSVNYLQGMTDLLAPLLITLDNESDAFWCFANLMERSVFLKHVSTRLSVEMQLEPLRLLLKLMIPKFYSYLESMEHGLDLMFCHRWLLVQLKREFNEADTISIWECCWSDYQTSAFQLFICVAIMGMYGPRAMEKNMNLDEVMLLFLNQLPQHMPKDIVLTQARGYLYFFSMSPEIHCSLAFIMSKDFWEQKRCPKFSCELCKGAEECIRRVKMEVPHLEREYVC